MQHLILLAAANGEAVTTFEWILRSEGWFFFLQTPLAILMMTVILSACDLVRPNVVMPKSLKDRLKKSLGQAGRRKDAEGIIEASKSPLASVLHAGIQAMRKEPDPNLAVEAMDLARERVALAMERRLTWINTLSHVAMSAGLLGTVWGLVGSFTVIASGGEAPPPHELAAGVSMALVTTIFGLMTALPGLFMHGVLQPASNSVLYQLDETSRELFGDFCRMNST